MSRKRERGQGLVEFALVFPVFVLIIFGLIDGGRLVYTYNTVSNAARDAARVAVVNQSTSGTNTCDTTSATAWPVGCGIQGGLALNLAASDVTVTYRNSNDTTSCSGGIAMGCLVVVKVQTAFQPLTPLVGPLLGSITLSSTTKMPIERICSNPTTAPIPHC